jgi:hypothetical protein
VGPMRAINQKKTTKAIEVETTASPPSAPNAAGDGVRAGRNSSAY